ncbi:hypothetical protein H4R35_006336 [Dimargaris xerosporica]|nr:hypothetical protein H4R35_006336 [Dimargaris xerosporica]
MSYGIWNSSRGDRSPTPDELGAADERARSNLQLNRATPISTPLTPVVTPFPATAHGHTNAGNREEIPTVVDQADEAAYGTASERSPLPRAEEVDGARIAEGLAQVRLQDPGDLGRPHSVRSMSTRSFMDIDSPPAFLYNSGEGDPHLAFGSTGRSGGTGGGGMTGGRNGSDGVMAWASELTNLRLREPVKMDAFRRGVDDPVEWFQLFNRKCEFAGFNTTLAKLQVMGNRIGAEYASWWSRVIKPQQAVPSLMSVFEAFVYALGYPNCQVYAMERVSSYTPRQGQLMAEWGATMLIYFQLAWPNSSVPLETMVHHFNRAVPNKMLACMVMSAGPSTFMEHCHRYDQVNRQMGNRLPGFEAVSTVHVQAIASTSKSGQAKSKSRKSSQQRGSNSGDQEQDKRPRCYGCGKKGHLKRNCHKAKAKSSTTAHQLVQFGIATSSDESGNEQQQD